MKKPIPFGKYYLLERVNVGGMAEVFKAKAFGVEGFERLLAVKRILPNIAEDKEFIQMFIDEAKIAVQLNHANVCQIFDLGKVEDSYFIALEYVHGKDVRVIFDRCKQKAVDGAITMPIAQSCFVVMKICEGLDYAHNKKDATGGELHLVHRDVSPQNIIISYEGEVKLIDFGIAKAVGKGSKTQAGILKGKFGYMSPEQVRGLPLDRRSDIFAVGICLYELLTGERLFVGESDFSTLEKVRNVEILPPSTYNRKIPDELERIVLKALAKDVEDRYQNAIDLHDDLQAFMYSAGEFYSRKDLAAWMKRSWAHELEEENAKMEAHRQFTPEPIMLPQAERGPMRAPPPPPSSALAMEAAPGATGSPSVSGRNGKKGTNGAGGKNGKNGKNAKPVATGGSGEPSIQEIDLDWDDEERETHVYDQPKDASGLIEAEISARHELLDSLELGDGAPVPAKPRISDKMTATPAAAAAAPAAPAPIGAAPAPLPDVNPLAKTAPASSLEVTRTGSAFELPAQQQDASRGSIAGRPAARPAPAGEKSKTGLYAAAALGVLLVGALLVYFLVIVPSRPGDVLITTDPADGVRLLVNGRAAHADLSGRLHLAPGFYMFSLEKDGFVTWNERIEMKPGELVKRRVDLEPLPRASFTLVCDPPGAQVFYDGNPLGGVTPLKVESLIPGPHRLEARLGDRTWSENVDLPSGKVVDLHCTLSGGAPPPPDVSHKQIVALPPPPPPDSPLIKPPREDRKPLAVDRPVDRPHALQQTPVEEHHAVDKPVTPVVEKPLPPPAGDSGFVRLGANPACRVTLDGVDTGKYTPISNPPLRLSAGTHRIVLTNPDFGIKESFTVDVKAGETQTVIKKLGPKAGGGAAPAPAAAPKPPADDE